MRRDWMVPRPRTTPARDSAVERSTFGTPLSPREDELMALFADGATYAEAAYAMGISYHTVKNHMSSIRSRLGAVSTQHAAAIWVRRDEQRRMA